MSNINLRKKEIQEFDSGIVPIKEKLAYGFGAMPGTFFVGMMGVIQSFYYGYLGLQWGWIVITQIIYAIWNVVNDPLFGNKINNTKYYNKRKNAHERYMPYIKFGAPLFSIAFALVFFPPFAPGNQDTSIQVWLFVWYLVSQLAYDTIFTLVLCAHTALLPQMTLNQREREKVQLISTIFSLPAILIGFLLPVIFFTNPTAESVGIFQILVICVAIFGVIPYWVLSRVINEHSEYIPEESRGIIENLKIAFKNKSFIIYIIYDGITVFILNILVVSLPFYITWYLGVLPNINMVLFWIGPFICLAIGIVISLKLAEKYSTKTTLSFYFAVFTIGFFFTFIVHFTYNWILVSIGFSIVFLAFPGDFIHHNPMRADTIDYDYWKVSGDRREGLYAGIGPLLSKPMISVSLAIPPVLMTAYGLIYVSSEGGLSATQGMMAAGLALNISMALIPGFISLIGLIVWIRFYPLTGDLVNIMKSELAKIHKEKHEQIYNK